MVKSRERLAMLTIAAGMLGCNALAGIHEAVLDACVEDAGHPGCVSGANSSSSGGGSAHAGATGSGGGGAHPKCGNGLLDPGEECDDKNMNGGDGCTDCKVDCTEPDAVRDEKTFHCYWVLSVERSFLESIKACKLYQGGQLATVTSQPELDLINSKPGGSVWIGASDFNQGILAWLDKEPWDFESWAPGEPSDGFNDHCVMLEGEPLLFGLSDCNLTQKALCERAPVVTP
jgi:cysteine-rich repeat protein